MVLKRLSLRRLDSPKIESIAREFESAKIALASANLLFAMNPRSKLKRTDEADRK